VETLEAATRRERHLATHDVLTGLPGRLHFEAELRRAIDEASRKSGQLAVVLLGLERFRQVNDRMGHAGGDEALLRVAERLTSVLRPGDLVARLAGDEFGVLLQGVRRAHDAARVARKLAESLADAIRVGERECWVSPSVGIALFPRDGGEADALVRAAHSAAREARTRGVGEPCFFNRGMDDGHRQRMLIETRLRRALEHGELELHYQPKVETATGRITGAEALLRWTDAELGMVEPKTVIPVAEETGLICAVAEWSLRTACAQNAAWRRAGFGALRMSVNLSPRQIVADDLRELVVRALWDTGLPPDGLELEITENSLVGNEKLALERLADLKNVGVTISLDDFGTGFCSLAYLKRFPVDILKIDQSFVRDIAVDPDDAAIVRAIISIADNLDLGVIAEGVETEEQRAFLQSRGCAEMQGFLVSPAIPADAFEEMLRKQAAKG
jgi:diguanylate cyclase (GGDEF)-like protein